ncbi:MAG: hypothetical protein LBG58_04300 [Planctomycetaceae bacterium]|jgi:hypothetical protein|nr:hypothetical protein [Planctomycetaceae bacterium]
MSKKNKTDDDDSSYQDFAEFSVVFTNWQEKNRLIIWVLRMFRRRLGVTINSTEIQTNHCWGRKNQIEKKVRKK